MKVTVILLLAGLLNILLFTVLHRTLLLHVVALRQQFAVFKRRQRKSRISARDRLFSEHSYSHVRMHDDATYEPTGPLGSTTTGHGSDVIDGVEARQLVSDGALLVDVRTTEEYADSHIEGAVNIPVGELSDRLDELGGTDQVIVLYCRSGNRSSHALRSLESEGFENVYDLGAYSNW